MQTILPGRIAAALAITTASMRNLLTRVPLQAAALCLAFTSSGAYAETPRIMVITSDPQYPWTPATDDGEHSDLADKTLAEALIREQYESIAAFRRNYPGQHIPVIVNGDLTSQAAPSEQEKIHDLLGLLGDEVYYGLGNHDYQNNLTNFVCSALTHCAIDALDNLAQHVRRHRQNGRVTDFDYAAFAGGLFTGLRKEGSWSYAFTPDGWEQVLNLQLSNSPGYAATINWGAGPAGYRYEVTPSTPWLTRHLPRWSTPGAYDFLLVHVHKPDEFSTGFRAPTPLQAMLATHRVAAVFAGHYHGRMGYYSGGFGAPPVFLSGSASQRTYLIVEHWPESKKLKVYGVRENDPARRELIREIDV
ncbi:MAG: metallophosphoesterase [Luteibacter sp.]|uniref:metallophosphoesterase n=1 Tax=Luteibacter sp. TaxID=1886636 RepID=UPI002806910C|nr:metallophosphoesterase [Luteibacter sp.]MDQ7997598.1 metallophosphoesterase [Luteibacter sp.]MDQ8047879.1 metallophosphoesterase [Luteibacter sp.]